MLQGPDALQMAVALLGTLAVIQYSLKTRSLFFKDIVCTDESAEDCVHIDASKITNPMIVTTLAVCGVVWLAPDLWNMLQNSQNQQQLLGQ